MEGYSPKWFHKAKPFICVVFIQSGYAGMDVLCKAALNNGMSNYVLVVYRHVVAFVVMAPFALILDKYVSLFHVCVIAFISSESITELKKLCIHKSFTHMFRSVLLSSESILKCFSQKKAAVQN